MKELYTGEYQSNKILRFAQKDNFQRFFKGLTSIIKMKLEHIALSVKNTSEIEAFYKDILGMKEVRNFVLNENLAEKIFGIPQETAVVLLQKEDLVLEIFLSDEPRVKSFNHICIAVADREKLMKVVNQNNYEVIRIERDYSDLVFIKDNSGNTFEIKES